MELPVVSNRKVMDNSASMQLEIRPDLKWFAGHFPEHPILPGVVQIAWAVHFSRQSFAYGPDVCSLEQIKFKRPIGPGRHITLLLVRRSADNAVNFEYRDEQTSFASGMLKFSIPI